MDDVEKKWNVEVGIVELYEQCKTRKTPKKKFKQSEVITPDLKRLVDPSVLFFVVALPPPDQASYAFILRSTARLVPILKQSVLPCSIISYYVPQRMKANPLEKKSNLNPMA